MLHCFSKSVILPPPKPSLFSPFYCSKPKQKNKESARQEGPRTKKGERIHMAEQKSSSKQGKKRTQISLGGGDGIGGVVVFGGALAIAGLIGIFTFKNRRRKDADIYPRNPRDVSKESKNSKREDEGSEGLRFISQTPSLIKDYGSRLTSHGTSQMSVTQIYPAKSLIMEEKSRHEISEENEDSLSGQQEIVLCDYSTLESNGSCVDCGVVGKYSLPVPGSPILIEVTMVKNDSDIEENNSISMKTIEDEKADEAISLIVHAEDKAAERGKSTTESDEEKRDEETDEASLLIYKEDEAENEKWETQSDEDEEEDEEGDIVVEGEESSEGTTGDSSVESNTEAIWPAELILDSSQELEQTDFIFQSAVEETEEQEDQAAKQVKRDYFNSTETGYDLKYEAAEEPTMIWKETHKPVNVNNQPASSSKLGIWIILSIMLPLLLLLLAFKNHKAVLTPDLSLSGNR